MSRALLLVLCPLLFCAQDAKEPRSPETVRYREFPEIIEEIAKDVESNDRALVVWLVDNAPMLKTSKHGELLAEAIPRCFTKPKISHAVVSLGERPQVIQKASEDPAKAAAAILALANAPPDNAVKDCLANVREAVKLAAGVSGGKKYLVLFTQENGDNESEVEETLKALKTSNTVFLPIVPEAMFSDPYWESVLTGSTYFFNVEKYRKLKFALKGPESAFIEFPYGWPFAAIDPAYTVPSGFAPWALDRLATWSGGRSYLYSVDRSATSFCQRYFCPLCGSQHKNCGAGFDELKLKMTAPEIGSRPEYGARLGKDKLYAATLGIWERLHKEEILRGLPPLRASGGGLVENNRPEKPALGRASGDWKAQRQEALKDADTVEKAANELLEASKKLGKDAGRRSAAQADALIVHLKLLSQAYRQLAGFCEELLKPRAAGDGVTSGVFESPGGEKVIGFHPRQIYLCHGGASLKDVKFLGDPAGLHAALDLADQMIEKHRGTPWELLIRRAFVPVFLPIFEVKAAPGGTARTPPDRSRTKSDSGATTTETPGSPARPARPVTGESGSGAGTATPGGNR